MSSYISPLFYRKISLPIENELKFNRQIFYDKHSKKLICFTEKHLIVYDKRGEVVKKKVNFELNFKVFNVSIDKMLKYSLLTLENNFVLLLNLTTLKTQQISPDSKVIGHFFISVYCCVNPYHNEITRFCLISQNNIIIIKLNNKDEYIELYKNKLNHIKGFCYNPVFLILCLEKYDLIFNFYNLANDKFYSKPFEFMLPLKKERKSTLQNFFSFMGKIDKNEKPQKINKKNPYFRKTQYFLEKIYKKLYFIILNFEDGELQIFLVSQLNVLKKLFKTIEIDNRKMTSLQIVDNLIVLHYFDFYESVYIDLRKDLISCKSQLSSHEINEANNSKEVISALTVFDDDDENNDEVELVINFNFTEIIPMDSKENKAFYNFELELIGRIMHDRLNNEYYYIYFNSQVYYNNSTIKSEAIDFLLRRKHSSGVICGALLELIKTKYKNKTLIKLFERISKKMNKRTVIKQSPKEKVCVNHQLISGQNDLINPLVLFYLDKTYLSLNIGSEITQKDLFNSVFRVLSYQKHLDMTYLLKTLLLLKNALKGNLNIKKVFSNPIDQSFYSLLISFFKLLENNCIIYTFIQYRAVPDNLEVARYLVDVSIQNKKLINTTLFHYALDILIRLKEFDEITKIFLCNQMEEQAILFLMKYKNINSILQTQVGIYLNNPSIISDLMK